MRPFKEIEKDLIANFVARQKSLTGLGVGGVIRGFFTAIAIVISELYYSIIKIKRSLFLDTCEDDELDVLGAERGLTRDGAKPAGTLLRFNGAVGTVIPAGTTVRNPFSNVTYKTKAQITLGVKNPGFVIDDLVNLKNPIIGDVVWAECTQPGIIGNSAPDTITKVNIANVTVTNPTPAQGGAEKETRDNFIYRIKNYVKATNQNTQAYYEALAISLDDRILRVLAEKDYSQPNATKLILVGKSGVAFSASELNVIADKISEQQHVFTKITCVNVAFTLISIELRVKLKPINNLPINLDQYYLNAADILSKYFDWSVWGWGQSIKLDEVFTVCKKIPQTDEIDLQTFKINGSFRTELLIDYDSLPYFQSIKITNTTNTTPEIRSNTNIIQSFD